MLKNNFNKPPKQLEYLGKIYTFVCNKGDLLCYINKPAYYDNSTGSTIIVEYRKDKRLADQFYILFCIVGLNGYDYGYTDVMNLGRTTRQAKQIYDESK